MLLIWYNGTGRLEKWSDKLIQLTIKNIQAIVHILDRNLKHGRIINKVKITKENNLEGKTNVLGTKSVDMKVLNAC